MRNTRWCQPGAAFLCKQVQFPELRVQVRLSLAVATAVVLGMLGWDPRCHLPAPAVPAAPALPLHPLSSLPGCFKSTC